MSHRQVPSSAGFLLSQQYLCIFCVEVCFNMVFLSLPATDFVLAIPYIVYILCINTYLTYHSQLKGQVCICVTTSSAAQADNYCEHQLRNIFHDLHNIVKYLKCSLLRINQMQ